MPNTIIDVNTLFGFWPKRRADIRVKTLLQLLQTAGIDTACALSAKGIFYDFEAGNRETTRTCEHHSELIPVATVNPARWIGCVEEARRQVENGVRLFRFFPQHQEWHIRQAPFRRLIDEVLARSTVGLIIPAGMGITAIGEFASSVDNPVIVEAFRYDRLAEAIVVMHSRSNVFVETHMINSPNFVELLTVEGLADRVVFGSYSPLAYTEAALSPIRNARVSADVKAKILGGNIRRLLEG